MVEISKYQFEKMRRKAGLCVSCGKEDAFTMIGRRYCADCSEKRNETKRKYWKNNENYREAQINKKRKIYEERKNNGICVRCGKRKVNGFAQCDYCRASQRRAWDRDRKKPRGGDGICYSCNKEKAIEGKKLCERCYNDRLKNCEKARKARCENFRKNKNMS